MFSILNTIKGFTEAPPAREVTLLVAFATWQSECNKGIFAILLPLLPLMEVEILWMKVEWHLGELAALVGCPFLSLAGSWSKVAAAQLVCRAPWHCAFQLTLGRLASSQECASPLALIVTGSGRGRTGCQQAGQRGQWPGTDASAPRLCTSNLFASFAPADPFFSFLLSAFLSHYSLQSGYFSSLATVNSFYWFLSIYLLNSLLLQNCCISAFSNWSALIEKKIVLIREGEKDTANPSCLLTLTGNVFSL